MFFWHCSKRVCQKFEMEDYKCHGAECVLYKSSEGFFRCFFKFIYSKGHGSWVSCIFFLSVLKKYVIAGVHFLL